ncbi:MAG: hypothetical protein K6A71_06345 [Lachnospiraceae bacterium]|nr:hypothetical protein [Lachnospiraceae bacterium]
MKELWASLITTYNNCRGTGKGLTLFLVSVLIICLLNRSEDEERINPLIFVLSPLSGIGYAFSRALEKCRVRSAASGILAGLLVVVTLILSGGWTFSEDDHYRTENMMHIRREYVDIMDSLLKGEEGTIRVVAPPGFSPYMNAYSDRFDVMYAYPKNGDPANLDADAGYVYEQMSLATPDQARLVERIRKAGYDHIIYNSQKTFFELPFEEYDYELTGDIAGFKIYRDRAGTAAASESGTIHKLQALIALILCFAFAGFCLAAALRSVKAAGGENTDKGKGGPGPFGILVIALIICQIVGVMIFSYDDPAALPCGVYGKQGFMILYSLLPLIMLPAYYYAYSYLAGSLFKDRETAWFMVLIICVLNLWGYQSKALLPATMLYCWFSPASVAVHGFLPFAAGLLIKKSKEMQAGQEKTDIGEEDDYFRWEEEEMKNHKIINSRNLAAALIIVVILFAGSVFVMNRKINSLYDTTVNLQQQVEELKGSE